MSTQPQESDKQKILVDSSTVNMLIYQELKATTSRLDKIGRNLDILTGIVFFTFLVSLLQSCSILF